MVLLNVAKEKDPQWLAILVSCNREERVGKKGAGLGVLFIRVFLLCATEIADLGGSVTI